jgi:lipoate-protein ligase A
MRLLDLTLADPAANLALDEALLLAAEESGGPEVLRFWELPTYAVVLGAGGSVAIDVNAAACARDGVPILRRASGGGTVVVGPGCLCYSLVLAANGAPQLGDIRASNRSILGRIAAALEPIVVATFEGSSDLAVEGLKVSGNAQQRKRWFILHHGTLLYRFDPALLERYLHEPERRPDYRRNRSHAEFVANLPITVEELKRRIAREWGASDVDDPIPLDLANQLIREKYARDDWNRRR